MKPAPALRTLGAGFFELGVAFAVAAQELPLHGFDEYVNQARAQWQVPGVAVAVVKADTVVMAKGYGVQRLSGAASVDGQTIFAIGSATKAFTAASIAMLVDEGRIHWDDPVTRHLKEFQLYDPYVTREITIRDLLCHRSGLDRADALTYGSFLDRHEILRRLRHQKPSWGFRSQFHYNNNLFLVAGQIVPAVTGLSWDDYVRARILTPLGMTSSSTSIMALKHVANVAAPHVKTGDKVHPIDRVSLDNAGPAGSINSSAVDLARWLRMLLAHGLLDSRRILSLSAVDEMQKPQMIVPLDASMPLMAPDVHVLTYGLGWFLYDYHGRKVVQHGGNIDGMVAQVGMMPELGLGVAILTNLGGHALPVALMNRIFDAYVGLPAQDWSARMLKVKQVMEARRKADEKKTEAKRLKDSRPSLAPGQYAGVYRSDMYGDAEVTDEQGRLLFRYSQPYSGALQHWHFDTFRIGWSGTGLGESFVTFTLDAQGRVDEMKVQGLDTFRRRELAPAPK